jgi:hypothetical protein
MVVRTVETTVAFKHSFRLISADTILPAGEYRLVTDEEEIPGLSFVAYRRIATMLHTPAISVLHGDRACLSITRSDLEAALTKDRQETISSA